MSNLKLVPSQRAARGTHPSAQAGQSKIPPAAGAPLGPPEAKSRIGKKTNRFTRDEHRWWEANARLWSLKENDRQLMLLAIQARREASRARDERIVVSGSSDASPAAVLRASSAVRQADEQYRKVIIELAGSPKARLQELVAPRENSILNALEGLA